MSPRTPNEIGFPGFTATRQKTSVTPRSRLDPAHEVVRPDRDAARGHEDVALEAAFERVAVRVLVVRHGDDVGDHGAR